MKYYVSTDIVRLEGEYDTIDKAIDALRERLIADAFFSLDDLADGSVPVARTGSYLIEMELE